MKVKLLRLRKGGVVILGGKKWSKAGESHEVADAVAHDMISTYPDMFAMDVPKKKAPKKVEKPLPESVKSTKQATEYANKAL